MLPTPSNTLFPPPLYTPQAWKGLEGWKAFLRPFLSSWKAKDDFVNWSEGVSIMRGGWCFADQDTLALL